MTATTERAQTTDLFAAVLEQQFPSLHPETGTEPPAILTPELGEEHPIGDPCPTCGTPRLWWIYNPFVKRSCRGWVQYRTEACPCPGSDPHRRAMGAAPPPTSFDQAWLDGQFLQRPTYAQTFLTFHCPSGSPFRGLLHAALDRAQSPDAGGGLFLAGPPSIGKGHLASALVNAARAQGHCGLSATASMLLDRSLATERETDEEQEARSRRRRALRAVPALAVRDLFRQPLLPTEVKELDLLLDYREGRGLATHFTSPYSFAQLHTLPGQTDARAGLVRRVERLTDREVIAPPRTPPFTERMARAPKESER